jgi:3-hydroxyacyl-CoA dehydrogenase
VDDSASWAVIGILRRRHGVDREDAEANDALLWSSTSNFPMTRLAAGMAHPERAIVVHPVQTQLIIFVEVVVGEQTSDATVTTTMRVADFTSELYRIARQLAAEST